MAASNGRAEPVKSTTSDSAGEALASQSASEYKELAQFVVIYEVKTDAPHDVQRTVVSQKTTVHHVEGPLGGGEDHAWEGRFEYDALGPWIRRRVEGFDDPAGDDDEARVEGGSAEGTTPDATAEGATDPAKDAPKTQAYLPVTAGAAKQRREASRRPAVLPSSVTITEVRITQTPALSMRFPNAGSVSNVLDGARPVQIEIAGKLVEADQATLDDDAVRLGARAYVTHLETLEKRTLLEKAATERLSGKPTFTLRLPPIELDAGSYRLDIVTVMEPTIMRQGHFDLPMILVG